MSIRRVSKLVQNAIRSTTRKRIIQLSTDSSTRSCSHVVHRTRLSFTLASHSTIIWSSLQSQLHLFRKAQETSYRLRLQGSFALLQLSIEVTQQSTLCIWCLKACLFTPKIQLMVALELQESQQKQSETKSSRLLSSWKVRRLMRELTSSLLSSNSAKLKIRTRAKRAHLSFTQKEGPLSHKTWYQTSSRAIIQAWWNRHSSL